MRDGGRRGGRGEKCAQCIFLGDGGGSPQFGVRSSKGCMSLPAFTTAARARSPSLSPRIQAAHSALDTMLTWSKGALAVPRGNQSHAHGLLGCGVNGMAPMEMKSTTRHRPRGKIKRPHMEIRRRTWHTRTVHMGTWKERTRRFNVESDNWTLG